MSNICIGIDAGHGGSDHGAVHDGLLESDFNLMIAMRVAAFVDNSREPMAAPLLRREDLQMTLAERGEVASLLGCDAVISIHTNAAASERLHGALAFHREGDLDGKAMGDAFMRCMPPPLCRWGDTSRGAPKHPTADERWLQRPYSVLSAYSVPALLCELGYLTHPADRRALLSHATQACMLIAIVAAMMRLRQIMEPRNDGI